MVTSWSEWINEGVTGWVIKAVMGLGFGSVVYAGWSYMKGQLDQAVGDAVANIPGSMYALLSLAGFIDLIGIWLGALTVAVTLLAFKKFAFLGA